MRSPPNRCSTRWSPVRGCRSSGPSTPTAAAATPASTASPARATPIWTSTPGSTSTARWWSRSTPPRSCARNWPSPPGARQHVALGTNTDPYQRAEGRYQLMPGIIGALADSGTPLSILTKGTLLARDIPLLKHAAAQVPVGVGISLAMTDEQLSEAVEPGTPGPAGPAQAHLPAAGSGPALRRHGHAHPAVALRQRRSPGLPLRLPGRGRRHRSHGRCAVPEARHPGMVHAVDRRPAPGPGRTLPPAVRHGLVRFQGIPAPGSPARIRYFKARHGFSGSQGFSHRDVDDPQGGMHGPRGASGGEEAACPRARAGHRPGS